MNPTFLPANITHYPISTNPIPTKKTIPPAKRKSREISLAMRG